MNVSDVTRQGGWTRPLRCIMGNVGSNIFGVWLMLETKSQASVTLIFIINLFLSLSCGWFFFFNIIYCICGFRSVCLASLELCCLMLLWKLTPRSLSYPPTGIKPNKAHLCCVVCRCDMVTFDSKPFILRCLHYLSNRIWLRRHWNRLWTVLIKHWETILYTKQCWEWLVSNTIELRLVPFL